MMRLEGWGTPSDSERGSPLKQGGELAAVHPVIRTNRMFSIFASFRPGMLTGHSGGRLAIGLCEPRRGFTKRINGMRDESDVLLPYLFNLVTQNHDAQVRFRWRKNDLAIWDNRSTWHTATYDYTDPRAGDRVCSLGEAPYLDLASTGRREALGL